METLKPYLLLKKLANSLKVVDISGGSRISPRWGRQLPRRAPTYDFGKISQKLHEIKRIWTWVGARPKFYYVDPPLDIDFFYYQLNSNNFSNIMIADLGTFFVCTYFTRAHLVLRYWPSRTGSRAIVIRATSKGRVPPRLPPSPAPSPHPLRPLEPPLTRCTYLLCTEGNCVPPVQCGDSIVKKRFMELLWMVDKTWSYYTRSVVM